MTLIRKMVKFEDLPDEAFEVLEELYPDGWQDEVRKITKPNGDHFYAISVETENAIYLAKVNFDVDTQSITDDIDDIIDKKEAKAAQAYHKKFDRDEDESFDEDDD